MLMEAWACRRPQCGRLTWRPPTTGTAEAIRALGPSPSEHWHSGTRPDPARAAPSVPALTALRTSGPAAAASHRFTVRVCSARTTGIYCQCGTVTSCKCARSVARRFTRRRAGQSRIFVRRMNLFHLLLLLSLACLSDAFLVTKAMVIFQEHDALT